jgi:Leucine-rich repeat (LRR) protein
MTDFFLRFVRPNVESKSLILFKKPFNSIPKNSIVEEPEITYMGSKPRIQHDLVKTILNSMDYKGNENFDPELDFIVVTDDKLKGPLSLKLFTLKNLKVLNLSVNDITGTIPNELSDLSHLEELDLSVNRLTGPLPRSIGKLKKLKLFNLNENRLTGSLPKEIILLKDLEQL